MIHRYNFPTEIQFGAGARKLLPEKLKELALKKPLVVTDKLVATLPFFDEIRRLSGDAPVYAGVEGNPVLLQVTAGHTAYREAHADSIIAVGGGAACDVAKAIALLANHDGDLFEYAFDAKPGRPIDKALPPIIALPTTAGTGSEVGRSTVISTDSGHQKKIMFSPKMLPRVVLADPELLLGLPAKVTAATGMDAVTHLIESYLTQGGENPLCDGIALEGLRLAARSLARSVEDGRDLSARADMLNAALMGAVAFQKGLGAVHSCAHALSTVLDLHHGLANGVMLPFVLEFNRDACKDKYAQLAKAVGAGDIVGWVKDLNRAIGIPSGLKALGGTERHLQPLAEAAFKDFCHTENPKPVTQKDFVALFTEALA